MEDLYEVIRRKMCVSRKGDRQLCTGIYRRHSAHQLLASNLNFIYICIICILSKLQVSEAPHISRFPPYTISPCLCFCCMYEQIRVQKLASFATKDVRFIRISTVPQFHCLRQ